MATRLGPFGLGLGGFHFHGFFSGFISDFATDGLLSLERRRLLLSPFNIALSKKKATMYITFQGADIDNIPGILDIWKLIFEYLTPLDMTALAQTGKNFYTLAYPDPDNPNLSERDILGDVVDFALMPAQEFFGTTSRQAHVLRSRYVSFLRVYKGGRPSFWTGAILSSSLLHSTRTTTNVLATELQQYQGPDWAHKTQGIFDPDFVTTAGAYMDAVQSETRFAMPRCQDMDMAIAARAAVDALRRGASGAKLNGVPIYLSSGALLRTLRANFKNRRARFFAYVNVAPWLRNALLAPGSQIRETARYLARFKNPNRGVCWRFTGRVDDFAHHFLFADIAPSLWQRPFKVLVAQDSLGLPDRSHRLTGAGRALAGAVEMVVVNADSFRACTGAIDLRRLNSKSFEPFTYQLSEMFPAVKCVQSTTTAFSAFPRLPRAPQKTCDAIVGLLYPGNVVPGDILAIQEMTPHHLWNAAAIPAPSLCMATTSYHSAVCIVDPPPRTNTYERFVVDLTTGAMPRLLQASPQADAFFAGEQLYLDTVPDLSLWTNNPGPEFGARVRSRVLELSIAFPDKALEHLRSTATPVAGRATLTATRLRNLPDVGHALADRNTLLHNFVRMIMRSVEALEEIVFSADPSRKFPMIPVPLPGGGYLTGSQTPGRIIMSVSGTDWPLRLVESAGIFDLGRAFAVACARWSAKPDATGTGVDDGNKTKSALRRPAPTMLIERARRTEHDELELRAAIAKRKGREDEDIAQASADCKRAKVYEQGVDLFDDWLEEVVVNIPHDDRVR